MGNSSGKSQIYKSFLFQMQQEIWFSVIWKEGNLMSMMPKLCRRVFFCWTNFSFGKLLFRLQNIQPFPNELFLFDKRTAGSTKIQIFKTNNLFTNNQNPLHPSSCKLHPQKLKHINKNFYIPYLLPFVFLYYVEFSLRLSIKCAFQLLFFMQQKVSFSRRQIISGLIK